MFKRKNLYSLSTFIDAIPQLIRKRCEHTTAVTTGKHSLQNGSLNNSLFSITNVPQETRDLMRCFRIVPIQSFSDITASARTPK